MDISVVIPCFNEADRLPATLQAIADFGLDHEGVRLSSIIIVDDGSTDNTAKVATSWKNKLPIDVISLPQNRGKGAALKAGMQRAAGDWTLLFDADSATPIVMIERFVPHVSSKKLIVGSRMLPDSKTNMSALRRFIGHLYYLLTKPLIGKVRDAACGFKFVETETGKKLFATMQIERFAYDVELFVQAHKQNVDIQEVPVEWHEVPGSKVHLLRDGWQMLGDVLGLYAELLAAKVNQASGRG